MNMKMNMKLKVDQYIEELQSRFLALEKREQRALFALAGVLTVLVFYLAVWSPLNTWVADSQHDHDRYLELLTYLRATEDEARTSAENGGGLQGIGQPLLTSVSRAAQTIGINPNRMQPEGSDAVSVWFDAVSFTRLMSWLEQLESQNGIVVRQISIDRGGSPGQVSARLVLRY